ncbi:MarR family transcriptional regulator [Myxococcus sp. CA051A]|uniref:MarR family winged helix-turn-helix transcriptional regulator n=1 Tax=unclassified Myxococcus TaxID=2648731 RepID=UPI00157A4278|nr:MULTISPECIES: MarR family transcriptional regulator [unclassified Myxococcus]NTX17210.1 MarR family transcriptional regulator [Myxococcus sp. CA056]NTX49730.1 MarR family transcriptional regulator [Myxococcus sp. CA039A]NTX65501.1 MarR family transcriptional regulator [Myxococcus sp. CA051A]
MKKPTQSSVPNEGLVDALVRAAFVTTSVLNRLGAENDLSLTLLRVCGILRDRRLRMVALADYLGLEKSTMTGLIDRAEKRGLVARSPSAEDGRAIDVFLTNQGAELVERLYSQVQQALAPLTERLNTADQQRLQALLLRMLDAPDS